MNSPYEAPSELSRLRDEIKGGNRVISLSGLTSISAKSYILSILQKEIETTFVVVADSNRELEVWESDLEFWSRDSRAENQESGPFLPASIVNLPSFETDIYSRISPHAETLERRALALWNLSTGNSNFVITSAKSLITRTISPKAMRDLGAKLRRDEDFPLEALIEKLIAGGYVREEPLKNVGEFSVRGGIVDVWSPDAVNPVRVEFFGDTVDSIREFDADTQLSIGQLKEIPLAPMREFAATPNDLKDWAFFAGERFSDERFSRNLKDRTQFAELGEFFPGWEFLINLSPLSSSLFDYVKNFVLVIDEPTTVELHLSEFYEHVNRRFAEINGIDEIGLEPVELFLTIEELRVRLEKIKRIELRSLGLTASETNDDFTL